MARLRQSQARRMGSSHRTPKPSVGRARDATARRSKATAMNALDPSRETPHTGISQSRNAYEGVSEATTSAPVFIKKGCSTTIDNMRAYNKKLVEFTYVNVVATFDFAQKLLWVKSPIRLGEQTKQLTALAQKVALASTGVVGQIA